MPPGSSGRTPAAGHPRPRAVAVPVDARPTTPAVLRHGDLWPGQPTIARSPPPPLAGPVLRLRHAPPVPLRDPPALVTDSNRPPTASATSSNRLPNRFWGRLQGPSLSQVNALLGPGGSAICRALDACAKFRLGPVARTGAGPVVVLGA